MNNKLTILCIIIPAVLLTANASSYLPCSNAKDCKAATAQDFSFAYVQAQNHFTNAKLSIAQNAAEELKMIVSSDQRKREIVDMLVLHIQDDKQALEQPSFTDFKKSYVAGKNADEHWHRVFGFGGEMNNLGYYELLIKEKIKFLNEIFGIWRGSSALMQVKTDEDAKEMEDINQKIKDLGEIKNLIDTEKKMEKLIQQIVLFLEIDA